MKGKQSCVHAPKNSRPSKLLPFQKSHTLYVCKATDSSTHGQIIPVQLSKYGFTIICRFSKDMNFHKIFGGVAKNLRMLRPIQF